MNIIRLAAIYSLCSQAAAFVTVGGRGGTSTSSTRRSPTTFLRVADPTSIIDAASTFVTAADPFPLADAATSGGDGLLVKQLATVLGCGVIYFLCGQGIDLPEEFQQKLDAAQAATAASTAAEEEPRESVE